MIIGFHIGDFLFDELEITDLLALDFASVGISDRSVTRSANHARRARSHRVTSVF